MKAAALALLLLAGSGLSGAQLTTGTPIQQHNAMPSQPGLFVTLDLRSLLQGGSATLEGLTATLRSNPQIADSELVGFQPVIEVAATGHTPVNLSWNTGDNGLDEVGHFQLGVGRLNRGDLVASLIVMRHSGGAHCCWEMKIVQPIGGKLVVTDGGTWDGGDFEHWRDDAGLHFPRDKTGDGVADFVLKDSRFHYAYTCYTCSTPVPLILNFSGGQRADVSGHPAFAPMFKAELADAHMGCLETGTEAEDFANLHACLVYAALASRLGQFEQAYAAIARLKARAATPFEAICSGVGTPCDARQWRAQPRLEDSIKQQLRLWGYPVPT